MRANPNILIINDGNRRWAKKKNISLEGGYLEMVKKIGLVCDILKKKGFTKVYITLCSLSNLERPKDEIDTFYRQYLLTPFFSKNKIKIELHGNVDLIPSHFKEEYFDLVRTTSNNKDFTLHYLVNFSMINSI